MLRLGTVSSDKLKTRVHMIGEDLTNILPEKGYTTAFPRSKAFNS
jgi:hypothetical protein